MIRQALATRNALAQARADHIDASATPGTLTLWSGGQPDPDKSVATIPAHAINTAYALDDYVAAVGHYYRAENTGSSAGSAPAWPVDGSTVTDNDITWQDMGDIPLLLGTLILSKPVGTVANGELVLAPITEDASADTSGNATWARIQDGDGNEVMDLDVSDLNGSAPIKLNTTAIVQGGPIRINTGTPAKIIEGGA